VSDWSRLLDAALRLGALRDGVTNLQLQQALKLDALFVGSALARLEQRGQLFGAWPKGVGLRKHYFTTRRLRNDWLRRMSPAPGSVAAVRVRKGGAQLGSWNFNPAIKIAAFPTAAERALHGGAAKLPRQGVTVPEPAPVHPPGAPVITERTRFTRAPSLQHDPRVQLSDAERAALRGPFSRAGIGRDVDTGRAW
jgi:hypothetical protein